MSPKASFPLATQVRSRTGAPLADVFAFVSAIYFRGKITYARTFANPPGEADGILVITTNRGLLPADTPTTSEHLKAFGAVDILEEDVGFRRALLRDARNLKRAIPDACDVVLLGSVATGKYVNVLLEVFGSQLKFPHDFVGRGDMSRGGLMLKASRERQELRYIPVEGAQRTGKRAPRIDAM